MDVNAFIAGLQAGASSGGSGGGGADVLNSIIDRSITEIESDATSIGSHAFDGCSYLITANFPKATIIGGQAFYGCSKMTSVEAPNATEIGTQAFSSNHLLTRVCFPGVTSFPYGAFFDCMRLESVDNSKATSIASQAFAYCSSLKAVILRSESLCKLSNKDAFNYCYHILGTQNGSYNPNGSKDGYFYVPSALVNSYKSATNWSTYASQFRALEDYTVDGTITGELDPNKI